MPSAPQTLQSAKGDRTTLGGLHFAVVSDKLVLPLTERRLDKEKYTFYYVNKSVCVTLMGRENCALLFFDFRSLRDSRPFFASCAVFLRTTLCRIRRNGNNK